MLSINIRITTTINDITFLHLLRDLDIARMVLGVVLQQPPISWAPACRHTDTYDTKSPSGTPVDTYKHKRFQQIKKAKATEQENMVLCIIMVHTMASYLYFQICRPKPLNMISPHEHIFEFYYIIILDM